MSQARIITKLNQENNIPASLLPSELQDNHDLTLTRKNGELSVFQQKQEDHLQGENEEESFDEQDDFLSTPKEQKESRGEMLFKQALILLNDVLLIDEVLKKQPNSGKIQKYLTERDLKSLQLNINTYANTKPDILIKEAKFFLEAAEQYGNEDAVELLKILNTTDLSSVQKTVDAGEHLLSPAHKSEAAKIKQLVELNESESITKLDNPIEIIDDYIASITSPKL